MQNAMNDTKKKMGKKKGRKKEKMRDASMMRSSLTCLLVKWFVLLDNFFDFPDKNLSIGIFISISLLNDNLVVIKVKDENL